MKRRWGFLAFVFLIVSAVLITKNSLLSYQEFKTVRITDRNGQLLRTILSSREATSLWVPLEKISPYLIRAQLAAEDKRFFHHPGIDLLAVGRAIKQNIGSRRVVSGASTITQQLVRVVRRHPRSFFYKAWEAAQAVLLEAGTSKKEILEHYLNRVPYGNQCYGIGAAADLYFAKPALQLSLAEAAFIAGLTQSPSKYNPYRHFPHAKRRQHYVLVRLFSQGLINRDEFNGALREPLALLPNRSLFRAPHFTDMVAASLSVQRSDSEQEIRTTLDLALQEDIEKVVANHVKRMSTERLSNAAVVVINNHTHEILAMVGSADYFNEEHDGQVNGALAARPPGSTWKPFTYALALEQGRTVADVIPDVPLYASTRGGNFTPRNYDERYHGPTRLRTALACSYNIPAVRVLEDVGTEALLRRLQKLGFSFLTHPSGHYGLGLTLGGAEASLLQLVSGYSAFANEGHWRAPQFLKNKEETNIPIFSRDVAFLITDILSDRDARRPAFGGYSSLSLPFHCAIKTGTSKNYRDGWTVGYTPDFTVGTWVGNFDGSPMKSISGASGASMLFKQVMLSVHKKDSPAGFPTPPDIKMIPVCSLSGLRPSPACISTIREKFIHGTEPVALCSVHRFVPIDLRTDLLASSDCDPTFVRHTVFEIYDPVYNTWAAENLLPLPPTQLSPLCETDKKTEPIAAIPSDPAIVTVPEILFPQNGDVFIIDPVLRQEYQTLHLRAALPNETQGAEWIINGVLFKDLRWPLQKGRHEFMLRVKIGADWKESKRITIEVI